jgi:uncharacterized protein YlxW (UPF0749 family)
MTDQSREPDDDPLKKPGSELPPEQPVSRAEPASGTSGRDPVRGGPGDDDTTPGARPADPARAETADGDVSAGERPAPSGRRRLAAALWPPRVSRAQLIAAVLLFVLGLGLAIQVRSTSESNPLRGARQEDLVRILDELDDRTARLQDEKQRLEAQRRELKNSSDQAEEARRQTMHKKRQLGVLAGTVAAQGPGLRITVSDPAGTVEADMLLDTIQELRAAGAEAIQINDVRVVAGTYFTGSPGEVRIDGKKTRAPYRFLVIGEPEDLEPALNIPGGVVQTLEEEQAVVDVVREEKIVVDALRKPERPDYARSSQ